MIKIDKYLHKYLTNICGRVFVDHCALCMMIMASIFLSGFGLGWVVLQACFVGWVGSISYWVGLGWITENGPTSMSALSYCYSHIIQKTEIADNLRQQTVY